MKKVNLIFALSIVALMGFIRCSEDEEAATFTLVSLTAGSTDLAGLTAASDVLEDAAIVAEFSSNVDAETVSNTSIVITNTASADLSPEYTIAVDGAIVTITPTNGWDGGSQFSIELASSLAGENGALFDGNTLTFRTSGIFVPNKDAQILHLSFDDASVVDETGEQTVKTVGSLDYDTDRRGTPDAAAFFDGNGGIVEVAEAAALVEGTVTISFWFKTNLADYAGGDGTGSPQTRFMMGLGVEKGYFLELGRRSNDPTSEGYSKIFLKLPTNHINIGDNAGSVPEATTWTELNADRKEDDLSDPDRGSGYSFVIDALEGDPTYISNIVDNKWVHMAMVIDGSARTKTIYVNGDKWATFEWKASGFDWLFSDLSLKDINNDGSPNEAVEGSLALGFAGSSINTATGWANHTTNLSNDAEQKKFFKGSIDEFRIFSMAFNDADIAELYNSEQ